MMSGIYKESKVVTLSGDDGDPLKDLDNDELKELIDWKDKPSYQILKNVVRKRMLTQVESVIKSGEFTQGSINELNVHHGKIAALDMILKLPIKAERLLKSKI
jgi:hypothetical protein